MKPKPIDEEMRLSCENYSQMAEDFVEKKFLVSVSFSGPLVPLDT